MCGLFDSSQSLHGRVFNEIRDGIIKGKYRSGESLSETRLARELGVSRTPVREAIRQLELEGLVRYVPNKGAIVEGITARDISEIYEIRELIEGLAARWACERITDEEIKRLGELADLMEFYTKRGDVEHVTKLDADFHQVILDAARSMPLKHALSGFIHYVERARIQSLKTPGRLSSSTREHREICDAIINRDPQKAEEAATRHVRSARENLLKSWQKKE